MEDWGSQIKYSPDIKYKNDFLSSVKINAITAGCVNPPIKLVGWGSGDGGVEEEGLRDLEEKGVRLEHIF